MRKVFLFSNCFNDNFGGMEEHRNSFVKYFKNDDKYALIQISNINNEFNIYLNDQNYVFNDLLLFISFLKTIVNLNDIFFFNDFWWINDISRLKQHFLNIKFIIRSGGNDVLRAPIDSDDLSLTFRQKKLVEVINKNINYFIVNSDYSYIVNRNLGINPKIMKKIRGGVDFVHNSYILFLL